jgi:hypothetical protein
MEAETVTCLAEAAGDEGGENAQDAAVLGKIGADACLFHGKTFFLFM